MYVTVLILTVLVQIDLCWSQCHDIDPQACRLMQQQNPGLCQDPALSTTACPKFCNLCPLTCLHCDLPVGTPTECNTTRVCLKGERCMLRELQSSLDGHHEYKMNCAAIDMCDGSWSATFGKRNVRTQCCTSDLCNSPSHQTTTALPASCSRDIEFLIEDSTDTSAPPYIREFLKDIVSRIDLGPTANQVGVALFDNHGISVKIHLKNNYENFNKTDFLRQIDHVDFNHRSDRYSAAKILDTLQSALRDGRNGNRVGVQDVAVILVDHAARHGRSVRFVTPDQRNTRLVNRANFDVILIEVGNIAGSTDFSSLATGSSHIVSVTDFASLSSIVSNVLSLICM